MKVTLIYFSQTGNTRKVTEAMAEVFREQGHFTRTVSLKKADPQEVNTSDLLGVGSPCFSSQAPTPVKEYLSSLPRLAGQRAFVFATCGGAPGRVLYDLTSRLQHKGAEVIGGFLTRGEVHHPAPCLTGRFRNRPNGVDLLSARLFAVEVSKQVSAGNKGILRVSHPNTIKPGGRFYNLVAQLSTDPFKRSSLPEPKLEPGRCNQCQWCVYECPMGNIMLQPNPVIGEHCIRCYRCLTGCPQKAFTIKWGLDNLKVWMFYNTAFERWFGDIKPGETIYGEN